MIVFHRIIMNGIFYFHLFRFYLLFLFCFIVLRVLLKLIVFLNLISIIDKYFLIRIQFILLKFRLSWIELLK